MKFLDKLIYEVIDEIKNNDPEFYKKLVNKFEGIVEISNSSNIDGYNTPFAFSKVLLSPKKKKDLTKSGKTIIDLEKIKESIDINDSKKTIADSIKKIRKFLVEIENILDETLSVKEESGVSSLNFYNRTHNHLKKIGEHIVRIINKIQSIKY